MTRTRSLDYDDKLEAVVETAARVIAERGYTAASVTEIAEACGVSKGHVYYYFPSKEAILDAILSRHLQALLSACEAVRDLDLPPREKFERAIAAIVRIYAHSRDKHVVFMTATRFLPPDKLAQVVALERRYARLVREMIEALHGPGQGDEGVITMLLFGMINWTYVWYDSEGAMGADALAARMTGVFLDGYLAARA